MTVEKNKLEEKVPEQPLKEVPEQPLKEVPEQPLKEVPEQPLKEVPEQQLLEENLLKEDENVELTTKNKLINRLEYQIGMLNDELSNAKDQALRAYAEIQDVKRRAEQDVEKAHKFALENFICALVPVVDSLEKGIESAEQVEGAHEALVEGMHLTLKQFLGALHHFSIEQKDPKGQLFDPNFHQAMSIVSKPEVEINTVIDVFQKGYTLNGRLIRPAMVVVSR